MRGEKVGSVCSAGAILLLSVGCQPQESQPPEIMENSAAVTAPILHIALQDGFDGVPVVVRVNGDEVYRQEQVLSDHRIGLADSFEMPKPEVSIVVEISLPDSNVTDSVRVELEGTIYVGVSYRDGAFHFKESPTAFGYV